MSDQPEEPKKEIPAFRFSEKKVDDSWKEEMRREREAAARAAEEKAAPPATGKPAQPQPAGASASTDAPQPRGTPSKEKPAGATQEAQQSKIFLNFLAGLAQQALMQMGEMENPFTQQTEVDLQGARYTIELLNVIMAKTKGNLSEDEERGLSGTIHDLRLRFVEIANEVQRQVQAQAQKGAHGGPGGSRPGPGGTIPGPGSQRRH
ncbi:MAG TPA: DUF1844 domain-containing protein [Planctomycetota bacterium]|jgi:hypothetical protein